MESTCRLPCWGTWLLCGPYRGSCRTWHRFPCPLLAGRCTLSMGGPSRGSCSTQEAPSACPCPFRRRQGPERRGLPDPAGTPMGPGLLAKGLELPLEASKVKCCAERSRNLASTRSLRSVDLVLGSALTNSVHHGVGVLARAAAGGARSKANFSSPNPLRELLVILE